MPARIAVVIVTYNSSGVIGSCLNSLPKGMEVICVDNQSTDVTCEVIAAVRPSAIVIKSPGNIGFGSAANIGFKNSDAEFFLLLNPDAVIDENSISELLDCAERNQDAMIVAPILLNADGTLQTSYRLYPLLVSNRKTKNIMPDGEFSAGYISGAVMLIRRDMLGKVGGFDEKIFLFYEDDDLCMRARKAGFNCILAPQAKAVHGKGESSGEEEKVSRVKNISIIWSRLYLEKKYRGYIKAMILSFYLCGLYALKTLAYVAVLNFRKAKRSYFRMVGSLKFMFSF